MILISAALTGLFIAQTIHVGSQAELKAALISASPGAHIVMANGTYAFVDSVLVTAQGTAEHPVVVEAETVGGVTLNGQGGIDVGGNAAYVTVKGFVFNNKSTLLIDENASHIRYTRNVVQPSPGAKNSYMVVKANDCELDFNVFQNRQNPGRMLSIEGPGSDEGVFTIALNIHVHHNHFKDFPNCGQNNCSALQIGSDFRWVTPAHALIEYNLFTNTKGENENFCSKSGANVYRFNTFENSTELSLRHGNGNLVYGNYFLNTDGLRIYGNDHHIHSNYFQGCSPAINLGNGGANVPPGPLNEHDRPDSVRIAYNTLVDNPANFTMDSRGGGLGAFEPYIANNLIVRGGTAASFSGPLTKPSFEGNIVSGTSGGSLPSGGYASLDPQLTKDAGGIYRLQAGSPAIGRGAGSYPWVDVDMDGQTRGDKRDVGADQYSSGPVLARPLTQADVGPQAPEPPSQVTPFAIKDVPGRRSRGEAYLIDPMAEGFTAAGRMLHSLGAGILYHLH
jgi:poly(beta-D-mannuronate) lyase